MKKFKVFLSFLLSLSMLFSTLIGNTQQVKANEDNGVTPVTADKVYKKTKYYKEGPLGIMGGFHLVGFNSVETKAHTNGNILTNILKYQSNFGTNNLEEVSYIRKLQNPVAGFKSTSNNQSILVVGKEISVTTADNGQAWALNGQKADFPRKANNPNGLWQDTDQTKFVDIEAEKQRAIDINQRLRTYQDSNAVGHFEDQNNQYVEISNPGGVNVYNLNPDGNYNGYNVDAKGFEKGKNGTLIFNVDLKGKTSFTMPGSVIKYKDGSTAPTSEVTTWQDGNTIWNFYDSSQPDGQYRGKINNSRAVTGIILAPSATVDLTQNFNGTTIANDIIVTAESHRTDFTGKTLDPTEVSVKVTKKWEGQKLDKVKVRLLANGKPTGKEVELSESNNWSYTFSKLSKKDSSGQIIKYTVDEVDAPGYIKEISGNETSGYIIKNTKKNTEKVNIEGTKTWEDNNNQDGKRPSKIKVILNKMVDGKTTKVGEKEVTEENWSYSFTDLPKYENGKEVKYTIDEEVVEGYTKEVNGYNLKNKYIPEKTKVEGTKTWEDNNNQDGKRPSKIKVKLLADGEVVQEKEVTEKDGWKYSFENLDKYKDGKEIKYTIDEDIVEFYQKTVNGFNLTNKYTPEKTKVEGTKTWEDNNNQDGKRPSKIKVKLLADGKEVATKEVTEKDGWKYSFDNLDKYKDGKEIKYTIDEEAVKGYTKKIKGYNLINTRIPTTPPNKPNKPLAKTGISTNEIGILGGFGVLVALGLVRRKNKNN
ncbi:Cna B-type domain-containing protein [Gemella cuniculi]|uniref:Cna B-type domain-containing protein n=1 Tax=Gemella cuniculi TaxID=150240 RepID=UPI0003FA5F34|nr:Cna B-type domain-containing protein [Gemella cuniculi]